MFDAFLKIDEIEGESTDDKHQGWIEIKSCDHRLTQKVSSTASGVGGASAERADFQDFRLTKQLDKTSPKPAPACADGTHIGTVTIELSMIRFPAKRNPSQSRGSNYLMDESAFYPIFKIIWRNEHK